jgi:hypothetical protein
MTAAAACQRQDGFHTSGRHGSWLRLLRPSLVEEAEPALRRRDDDDRHRTEPGQLVQQPVVDEQRGGEERRYYLFANVLKDACISMVISRLPLALLRTPRHDEPSTK